jgi:hypothetical protein
MSGSSESGHNKIDVSSRRDSSEGEPSEESDEDDFQDEDLGCRLVLANSVTSLISEIQKLEPSADDIRTFKRLAESYYAHTLDANMRVQVIVNPPKNRNDWASLFKDLRDVALILTKKQNGETDRESANREIHSRIALLMSTVFAQMEVEISIRLLKQAPQANLFNSADPEYQKKLDQTVLARLYFLSVLSSITRGEKVSIPDPAFQETAIKWLNLLLHGKNEITQGSTSFKGLINKLL